MRLSKTFPNLFTRWWWSPPRDEGPCCDYCNCNTCWNGWLLGFWHNLWSHLKWRFQRHPTGRGA